MWALPYIYLYSLSIQNSFDVYTDAGISMLMHGLEHPRNDFLSLLTQEVH